MEEAKRPKHSKEGNCFVIISNWSKYDKIYKFGMSSEVQIQIVFEIFVCVAVVTLRTGMKIIIFGLVK